VIRKKIDCCANFGLWRSVTRNRHASSIRSTSIRWTRGSVAEAASTAAVKSLNRASLLTLPARMILEVVRHALLAWLDQRSVSPARFTMNSARATMRDPLDSRGTVPCLYNFSLMIAYIYIYIYIHLERVAIVWSKLWKPRLLHLRSRSAASIIGIALIRR